MGQRESRRGAEPALRWFVLNVEANVEVDLTALEAMETLRDDITGRGAVFALARVKQDLLARLQAFGLAGKIGPGLLFPTLPTAVQAYQDKTKASPAGHQGHNPRLRGVPRLAPHGWPPQLDDLDAAGPAADFDGQQRVILR